MQTAIITVVWDLVHSRNEKCRSAISCQVNVSLPADTRNKEFHTMFVFSFINITHGPSCCCHPSLPGVFSKLVHRLIQNKQHIHPLSLTVLWLFVPQGSSQGRSLRAGGDLPAGGGGQPVRGPSPAGQLRLQRLAFGRPGHLPRWIPAYLKPGWRGQQRGVNPAISLWNHPSSSAVARPQSVQTICSDIIVIIIILLLVFRICGWFGQPDTGVQFMWRSHFSETTQSWTPLLSSKNIKNHTGWEICGKKND